MRLERDGGAVAPRFSSSGSRMRRGVGLLCLVFGMPAALSTVVRADFLDAQHQVISGVTGPEASPAPSAHLSGAPLPSGPDAPAFKDFLKVWSGWLDRVLISRSPAAKDPATAAYMEAAGRYITGDPAEIVKEHQLVAQGRSFNIQTVDDPGLLLLISVIEPFLPARLAALDRAESLLPASPYPKFIWFMVAANAGKTAADSKADAAQLKERDDLSLKYLAQGLADDSFQPSEVSVLRARLGANSVEDLISRNAGQVAATLNTAARVPQWVKEYIEGVAAVEAAWKSRGADWANHVSDQGWRGFSDNLAAARTHLVKSWQLNPHDPAAAAEMITVCMGESEATDTMRTWFDRAVAAEFDYMPAYKHFLWGLRPRWLGSFADLTAIGRECAATGRYDTLVPYELVCVAMDISSDADQPQAPFANAAFSTEVLDVLDKYLAAPAPIISQPYNQTLAAILAHKLGHMDEVKRHLAAIDYAPLNDRHLELLDDLPALAREARAFATP
jgi:hypothetical protein